MEHRLSLYEASNSAVSCSAVVFHYRTPFALYFCGSLYCLYQTYAPILQSTVPFPLIILDLKPELYECNVSLVHFLCPLSILHSCHF